jgi:hypothetical protein
MPPGYLARKNRAKAECARLGAGQHNPATIHPQPEVNLNRDNAAWLSISRGCMSKYQFFRQGQDPASVTFLLMSSPSFLPEKEQLLTQGFEVVGDYIQADSDQEALEKFRSGMLEPLEEYTKATEAGGLYYFITGLWEALNKRVKGTKSPR